MKRIISAFLAALVLLFALSGCSDKNKNKFYAHVGGAITSLDPMKAESKAEQTYIANLFTGLYSYSYGEDGVPVLSCEDAKELPTVKELDNGMFELTFTLKENLTWSNGEVLTPEDYVYSWNRAAKYFLGSQKSYIFSLIDGYDTFVNYDEDPKLNMSFDNSNRSFTVVVKEASERFLSYTTETALFPVSRIAIRDSKDWATNPESFASNGKYTLEALKNDRLTIKKNENYRDAQNVKMDAVEFLFDIDEAEKLYAKGRLSFSLFTEDTSLMQHKTQSVACASSYMAFNAYDPALGLFTEEEKAKIRRAVSAYIFNADIFADKSKYDISLSPPLRSKSSVYDMTENAADTLLKEVAESSGRFTWQDGAVYEFPILTVLNAGRTDEQKKLASVADILSSKGISLQIINCSWEEFLNERANGNYSMLLNSWSYNTSSPGEVLSLFLSHSVYNDTMAGSKSEDTSWALYDTTVIANIKTADSTAPYSTALKLLEDSGLVCPLANAFCEYYASDSSSFDFGHDAILRIK